MSGWLLLVAIIATVGLLAAYYVLRVRRLERNEERLRRLVYERTAELRERTAQLEIANEALEQMATADALTGVANRRRFDVFIQQEWQRALRSGQPLSVLLVDADHFKAFNDTYGHQAGDECLRRIAGVLSAIAHRVSDLPARYGGEEFSVVLANTDRAGASRVAESIRQDVRALQLPHAKAPEGFVTVSIGVATREDDGDSTVADLIGACDRALYEAKRRGRNRVVVADDRK